MKIQFDSENFSKHIRQKRLVDERMDVRSLAKKIGTSASTISRAENGCLPEIDTYAKLCHWIGRSMDEFLKVKNGK